MWPDDQSDMAAIQEQLLTRRGVPPFPGPPPSFSTMQSLAQLVAAQQAAQGHNGPAASAAAQLPSGAAGVETLGVMWGGRRGVGITVIVVELRAREELSQLPTML
jgi:hypothetical protein